MESQNVELKLLPSGVETDCRKSRDMFLPDNEHGDMDQKFSESEAKSSPLANGENDDDGKNKPDYCTKTRSGNDDTFHALSGLYAQIIIVVAVILVFTEVLHGPVPLLFFHGYLFTYLIGGGIICFIGIYVSMLADKCPRLVNRNYDRATERSTFARQFVKNLLISDISIYLRIGALVFGLGTVISSGLEIASLFSMQDDCMDELNIVQPVLRGLFSFLQMHFLFINVREIVHALGWFRHAALMHLAATNIAIWIRLVLWESAKDWLQAEHIMHNASTEFPTKEFNISVHLLESDLKSTDILKQKSTHKVFYTANCWWRISEEKDSLEHLIGLHMCLGNSTIGAIWEKAMPYLYPFIIQYSLVAAGVVYIIWSNLPSPRTKLQHLTAISIYKEPRETEKNCVGSTTGLFLGLLVLVAGVITLILFFVLADNKELNILFVIADIRCGIFVVSTLAATVGLLQIRKMKSKTTRQKRLAELLQSVGMLAVYAYGICNMIVGGIKMFVSLHHVFLFMDGMLMVLQACIQSLFIYQVSKKRLGPANTDEKPGRQVVIFLVFINLVLWLFESFTTQHINSDLLQKKFYGEKAWSVISNGVLPLVIFYRFHSIASLMEAWRKSYKIKQN